MINAADKRVERSQVALRQAFFQLLLTKPYETSPPKILRDAQAWPAQLSTPTLKARPCCWVRAARPMVLIAQLVSEEANELLVANALDHFVAVGSVASALLKSGTYTVLVAVLSSHIDGHLRTRGLHRPGRLFMPPIILSSMLAEALLAGIRTWLFLGKRSNSSEFSLALARVVRAMIETSCASGLSMHPAHRSITT